jgi:hypothetical protein
MTDEQVTALRADLYHMAQQAEDEGKHEYAHGLYVAIYQLDAARQGLRVTGRGVPAPPLLCGRTCGCGSPCPDWKPLDV